MRSEFLRIARIALDEDLADGTDITTEATVPADARFAAQVVAREAGVLAGLEGIDAVFELLDPDVIVTHNAADGDDITPGQPVATIEGPARAILTGERTALNLVSRLSGIATQARRWASLSSTQVVETRKTTPGLRVLEKYAVRCGGGHNHRQGLHDAFLIKDNHIAIAGGVREAIARCRPAEVEIEVDTIDQLREALDAGAEWILLDNMTPAQVDECVALTQARAKLEVSGGVKLDTISAYKGVDRISVGAITNAAPIIDFGLDPCS